MPSIYPLLSLRAQHPIRVVRWAVASLLGLLLTFAPSLAQAQLWPARPAAAIAEAQNEIAAPSLSRHVHDVERITDYLVDALRLSTAQQMALQHCTVAERSDLLLATCDKDAREAQMRYLASVRRVLASSQLRTYVLLRQQLEGTLLPLEGLGLAAR